MIFRVGIHEKPIYRGELPKWGGGAWTVCRFKRVLGEKEQGVFKGGGLIPQCILCYLYKFKGRPNTVFNFHNPMMNFRIKNMQRTCLFEN